MMMSLIVRFSTGRVRRPPVKWSLRAEPWEHERYRRPAGPRASAADRAVRGAPGPGAGPMADPAASPGGRGCAGVAGFQRGAGRSCLPLVPGWVVAEDLPGCAGPEVSVEYLDAVSADQLGMGDSAGGAELE